MDDIKTGEYIREKRMEKGWSQEDFANAIEVSARTISSWENGKVSIKKENMEKLAEVFGVSYMELKMGKDMNELSPETRNEISEHFKELDDKIVNVQNITIDIEEGTLLSTDVAVCALSFSFFAEALGCWAAFGRTMINIVCVTGLALIGIAFLIFGKVFIRIMDKRLKERKIKTLYKEVNNEKNKKESKDEKQF